jgi:hypothetical protein
MKKFNSKWLERVLKEGRKIALFEKLKKRK